MLAILAAGFLSKWAFPLQQGLASLCTFSLELGCLFVIICISFCEFCRFVLSPKRRTSLSSSTLLVFLGALNPGIYLLFRLYNRLHHHWPSPVLTVVLTAVDVGALWVVSDLVSFYMDTDMAYFLCFARSCAPSTWCRRRGRECAEAPETWLSQPMSATDRSRAHVLARCDLDKLRSFCERAGHSTDG